ncbi:MAG TPA: dihydrofolate reductase family protein [Pyrinomonadaceae bacterium]|nr:dihydrofolate reductase family protein [Pyrinomonadaceae bacterium]
MRKVTLGLANSLDNYIARQDGGSDWLVWSKEVAEVSARFMKTVDAILIGRKTFEVMLGYGQTSYPGGRNYVFSRSRSKRSTLTKKLARKPDRNVEVVTEDAAAFVRKLKSRKGKGIVVFGGGEFAKALFEADLIDEIVLNIHPVLLGSGIPLFHEMKQQIDLEFLESRTLKNGNLIVSYRVKH